MRGEVDRMGRMMGLGEQEWRREIVKRLDRIDADIKQMMYTMIGIGGGLFAAIVASNWLGN